MEKKDVLKEWLAEFGKESTKRHYLAAWEDFEKWSGKTAQEFYREYKASADKDEWAREIGKLILKYYNWLLSKGYKINTARLRTIAPRSFFASQCTRPRIKKGAIPKAQIALGEHEFTIDELRHMYRIADVRERAILTTAITLGWSADDFVHLKRETIEPYLNEDLEPPIAFWYQRGKTGALTRVHLTHEAIESLRNWLQIAPTSPYVFPNSSLNKPMRIETLNDIVKKLFERTKRKPRGKIRFHLFRKFLMSQLANSRINEWHIKLMIGKQIPSDILTYLKDQTDMLRQEFQNAEPLFSLSGFTNQNHTRLEALQTEVAELRGALKVIARYVAKELGVVPKELKAFVESENP